MSQTLLEVKEHPIMITLQDAIAGDGFLARITLSGRALMRKEGDGKWWMYGVAPAGIAASGLNVDETFLRFRTRYKEILFDIAEESDNFEDFKTEVNRFFTEKDADTQDADLWERALAAVRGGCPPPGPFAHLPRATPESSPAKIEIVDSAQKKLFTAKDNVVDTYSVAKAA